MSSERKKMAGTSPAIVFGDGAAPLAVAPRERQATLRAALLMPSLIGSAASVATF
jgi:ribosomal protein L25 (general stress protein Ctc)